MKLKFWKGLLFFFIEANNHSLFRYSGLIGFCGQKFPLEGNYYLGFSNTNSIGHYKEGILIDGSEIKFRNVKEDLTNGDVLGLGLIRHTNALLECFATCNGELLGKIA